MPPPPISDCMASTAGLGLVCRESSDAFCCFRLFKSAIAAAPVNGAGDVLGERPGLSDLGEISARDLGCDSGLNRVEFGAPGFAAPALFATLAREMGVRGASSGGNGSACGLVARVVAAMGLAAHLLYRYRMECNYLHAAISIDLYCVPQIGPSFSARVAKINHFASKAEDDLPVLLLYYPEINTQNVYARPASTSHDNRALSERNGPRSGQFTVALLAKFWSPASHQGFVETGARAKQADLVVNNSSPRRSERRRSRPAAQLRVAGRWPEPAVAVS
jgi:hypothetical protein